MTEPGIVHEIIAATRRFSKRRPPAPEMEGSQGAQNQA
jgi:hypothetical protein